jgi:hypothetical protein
MLGGVMLILLTLLITTARADPETPIPEPPARPESFAAIEGECTQAWPLEAGRKPPRELFQNGVAQCSASCIPLSHVQDLLAAEKWGEAVWNHHQVAEEWYLGEIQMLRGVNEEYRLELERMDSWWRKPSTQRAIGAGAVFLVGGLTVWGLSAV